MQPSQLGKIFDSKFLLPTFASSTAFRQQKFSCLFFLTAQSCQYKARSRSRSDQLLNVKSFLYKKKNLEYIFSFTEINVFKIYFYKNTISPPLYHSALLSSPLYRLFLRNHKHKHYKNISACHMIIWTNHRRTENSRSNVIGWIALKILCLGGRGKREKCSLQNLVSFVDFLSLNLHSKEVFDLLN